MFRFILASVAAAAAGGLVAAPTEPDVKKLMAKLSDRDEKVRDEASAALKGRADALPWLRRAARSRDPITSARANLLLEAEEKKRQQAVAKAIDACLRDGSVDLLTEWHQYWQPEKENDLWSLGRRAAKGGLELSAKSCSKAASEAFEKQLAWFEALDRDFGSRSHDGPYPERFDAFKGAWLIRTDRLDGRAHASDVISFASVAGPARLSRGGGQYLVLGPVEARHIDFAFVACDGGIDVQARVRVSCSIVVCRGNVTGGAIGDSVLLVDGDIDLTRAEFRGTNLIRASGEIRLPPRGAKLENCDIKAHAKDATAPYKFFELDDVGLSVASNEKGVAVTAMKANTPFGNAGLAAGDLIRAIDDTPAASPEEFRKKVRRAMVRQGDCLLTVVRGDKTLDLPVFFPLPK